MQKKDYSSPGQSSGWQDSIKSEQRTNIIKKIAIWGVILLAGLAGLGGLVYLADKSTSSSSTPVEVTNFPLTSGNDIVVGDPKAQISITEYSDFQCPACASYNPILNQVLEEYKGKVKLVYRHFPLRGIHKNAVIAGQAGVAAEKLGKFSEMKDLLFENQADWEGLDDPRETFEGYASSIGLNVDEFKKIMNSDEAKNAVEAGEREAIGLGLNSTPSFFIGNRRIQPRNLEEFKQLIDEELQVSN
ncbi:MAG: DsbA family protein [Candidatus Levybacteria bacterium]|nr:DsbA family protein [Candidatus Levybacteria bacterium]